jgi:uncharacterized protein
MLARFSLLLAYLIPATVCAQVGNQILEGAKKQLLKPAAYDGSYMPIPYPEGDVPSDRGVCTDVVIRAMRHAGLDLQRLIHEDMKKRFSTYPRRERKPDPNIDHRRVPNQMHYLRKFAQSLPLDLNPNHWKPGDIVYWKLHNGLDHCGIVSDKKNRQGLPLVVHNIRHTAEEDVLAEWKIIGHFRMR